MADQKTQDTAAAAPAKKAYYHLYASADGRFQRGLHLFSPNPAPDGYVGMPGYPKVKLSIARYPHHASNRFKLDENKKIVERDGKPVFLVEHYGKPYEVIEGDPIIYEAPGHEGGAELDHARLDAEGEA